MDSVYIGTNWKMHKTAQEGIKYIRNLQQIKESLDPRINLFVIPPYTSLWQAKAEIGESRILLGAQNMHWADEGAYTGEISPQMLSEIGIHMVELGHSERRQYYNENDHDLNKKVLTALRYRFKPLICIGESEQAKADGLTYETVISQLKVCLKDVESEQAESIMIAYEPVWAIGAEGQPAEPDYVEAVHSFIREFLVERFGNSGKGIPILYGGSINEENSIPFLRAKEVNGLFIGRAAWDIVRFEVILNKVNYFINS